MIGLEPTIHACTSHTVTLVGNSVEMIGAPSAEGIVAFIHDITIDD